MEGAVGIDLGTTTSYIAGYKGGHFECWRPNNSGCTIDSVVAYTVDSVIAGNSKIYKGHESSFVYEVKRLIGRRFDDVQDEINRNKWSFQVVKGNDGMAEIKVIINKDNKEIEKTLRPEEVSSSIVAYLREGMGKYLDMTLKKCVIACPVQFSTLQRQATLKAGYLAGFEQVYLVAEPTAAAIAFANKYDRFPSQPRHYLVYDLGGGTFDASVLYRNGDHFKVLNTEGNSHLGGKDIDVAFMDIIEKSYLRDRKINPKKKLSFKLACKDAKECLLTENPVELCADFCIGYDDNPINVNISQSLLRHAGEPIIKLTLQLVEHVLETCDPPLTHSDIDNVFLMGGSSSMNMVRDVMSTVFPINRIIHDPSDLTRVGIALGAAIIANKEELKNDTNIMNPVCPDQDQNFITFQDISPHIIRVSCSDGGSMIVVPQRTPIGEVRSIRLCPMRSALSAGIIISSGESENVDENVVIGSMKIPLSSNRRCEEHPLLLKITVLDNDGVDVVVIDELRKKKYHTLMNAGLSSETLSSIKSVRLRNVEEEKRRNLIKSTRQSIQKSYDRLFSWSNENRGSKYEVEINELIMKSTNTAATEEEFDEIKNRLKEIENLLNV